MRYNRRNNSKVTPLVIVIVLLLCISGFLYNRFWKEAPIELVSGECQFHFIDVGQGDSTLIVAEDAAVLIDAGPASSAADTLSYVKGYTDKIDYFILSHPDEDHIGGASEIIEAVEIDNIIMTDAVKDTVTFERLLDSIELHEISVIKAEAYQEYNAGDIELELLSPIGDFDDYNGDYNEYSIVTKVQFGKNTLLVMGDAGKIAERRILSLYGDELKSDIIRLAHHGSSSATGEGLLDAVKPEYAIISCGKNNSYGHPHDETLSILDEYGIDYYRTDLYGNIIMISDGKSIKTEK